ncbi:MAG: flippase-like domain-containing protein, partial [Synergistes sp.]|nr:flippase-like domain-containing protein [Synergistes sp.]
MTVKKSFSIFMAIVILSIIGVLFSSIDKSTFTLLGNADWRFLILAFGLVVLGWLLDSLKFLSLARAAGERLLFRTTLGVVWINYFGCAITPMQSGGGPFQVYMLYRAGVSVGKSIAITLVRTLQILFLLALVTPFSYFFDPKLFEQHKYIRWYAYYIAVFVALCTFLIVVSIIRPNWIKHWVNVFLFWLKRIGLLKSKYLMKAVRWVDHEVDSYNTNIKLFTSTGKR